MTRDADRRLERLQKRIEDSEDISSDALERIGQFVRLADENAGVLREAGEFADVVRTEAVIRHPL
ncbi:hypothetical protein [Natrinema altunense]|uniref:Uncharacterized protein n=1 Tax=Natrinema altunense (strain JCM 12890 / CGMCC 1.3731 / AJ2) TaxID=1227494 RepID=L9ZZ31_NATA2|nr:hypothetical protein [Natrinema altunense]ELY91574.1 hypothetical protein C485_01060 [Natrinema altunense JCM 12890]